MDKGDRKIRIAFRILFWMILSAGCAPLMPPGTAQTALAPKVKCPSDDWTVVRNAHFGQSALSVMFGDESFGVAADLAGRIHYTEDGGTTWTGTIKAGASRAALEISEGNRQVWYIGVGGDLLLSTDRAHTWRIPGVRPDRFPGPGMSNTSALRTSWQAGG